MGFTNIFYPELQRKVIFPANWDIKLSNIVRPVGGNEQTFPTIKFTNKKRKLSGYISSDPLIARLPRDFSKADFIYVGFSDVEKHLIEDKLNEDREIVVLLANCKCPTVDEIQRSLLIYMQYPIYEEIFPLSAMGSPLYKLELLSIDYDEDFAYILWRVDN